MSKSAKAVILFIAQGAYAGRSPFAPGTAGTLVGVLLYLGLMQAGAVLYAAVTVLVCVVGTWTAGRAEELLGCTDCPSIVIDEIAGFLVSMFLVPVGWGYILAGFFLFRIFDIIKPWPLYDLQSLHGGLGVMLDDVGAGVYTNLVLQIAAYLISR
jgi:phosphatidylglycerophosphatase A